MFPPDPETGKREFVDSTLDTGAWVPASPDAMDDTWASIMAAAEAAHPSPPSPTD